MIQFITHSNERYGYVDGARMALEGGCRWIQLRMKDASEADFLSAAKEISKLFLICGGMHEACHNLPLF